MRRARINRDWWKAKLLEAPGLAIAGIFIAVSGLLSVTFGFRLGEPSGNALIFAAVALAIEGFADLALPLFWRRLGLLGRVVLIAFFGLCLAYKLEAAKRFAAENLGKRDAVAAATSEVYSLAKENIERLRKTVTDNADARAVKVIQAEIDELLLEPKAEGCPVGVAWNGSVTSKICPKVAKLRGEFARAEVRDKAQADLAPAIAAWTKATPAANTTPDSTGPVAFALAALGMQVGGWSQLIASLIMAIVEGGAIIVPMLIGAASREVRKPAPSVDISAPTAATAPPAPTGIDGAKEPPQASPLGVPTRAKRGQGEVASFMSEATDHAPGERVQASKLYAVYFQQKMECGETPMKVQQFGTVLTRDLGLRKTKIGGVNWYHDIRLRHPAQGRKTGKHLQAVAA
jgi:hypothetical protein